ncbi:hypothetical protein C8Q76DRAFT_421594 [Earliella scabrosa]|nr:hypothetical protein C8Q76DRAFT_421594 [Earliella scabrosa]
MTVSRRRYYRRSLYGREWSGRCLPRSQLRGRRLQGSYDSLVGSGHRDNRRKDEGRIDPECTTR